MKLIGEPMRGLTLWQPWATLVAEGAKVIETRSWSTSYRGFVAIHASKAYPHHCRELCLQEPFRSALKRAGLIQYGAWHPSNNQLPLGAIVAVANLHKVGEILRRSDGAVMVRGQELPMKADEIAFGDFTPGRYGWVLANARPLKEPIPWKGALGLWKVPADLEARIWAALGG